MDIREFKDLPILGILRGIEEKEIEPLASALVSTGLKAIEITMNTQDAGKLITRMKRCLAGRMFVGAGTVLSTEDLKIAIDSGASFIVSPVLIKEVVEYCVKEGIPVFPGAVTPQEIYDAWNAGATMVKVFPAKFFGSDYIKEIKGPFDKIKLLACGGVNPKNIGSFFSSGASAVAFGGSIFKRGLLEQGLFSDIQESISSLIRAYKTCLGKE